MQLEFIRDLKPHFGNYIENLYSYKELESLLNLRPFCQDGRLISAKDDVRYEWSTSPWLRDKNTYPISIVKELINKDVCYISECGKVNAKINDTCRILEDTLQLPTDCHIYFSFTKGQKGFDKHSDDAHNLIVVSDGVLKVEYWLGDNKEEKEITNGEYVFISANVYHRITPITDKRLSCSFCIDANSVKNNCTFEEREWLKI